MNLPSKNLSTEPFSKSFDTSWVTISNTQCANEDWLQTNCISGLQKVSDFPQLCNMHLWEKCFRLHVKVGVWAGNKWWPNSQTKPNNLEAGCLFTRSIQFYVHVCNFSGSKRLMKVENWKKTISGSNWKMQVLPAQNFNLSPSRFFLNA